MLCTEYIYYEYEDGAIKPVQVYACSSDIDEKMPYLKGYIIDRLNFKGYLDIGNNGIEDGNLQPYQECTPDEINSAVRELLKDGILVRKGDRLYVCY